jgi:ubiquinone/menaquinone biosynthesis C-methylase UbiE
MSTQKNWTGERLETFITNETMTEHLHRYALAMEFIAGKKVLDIACGEGYGTNLMSKKALHVTGIDIDNPCIENAKKKYTAGNIFFSTGSVLKIPARDNSFDVITCFETLEHINEQKEMLAELKRVLSPSGILLISTPDKKNYSDKTGYKNPFHKKELYEQDFKNLVANYFPNTCFYKQNSYSGSMILNEKQPGIQNYYNGDYENINALTAQDTLYWIAIASENELPLLAGSFFKHPKTIAQLLEEQTEAVKKTMTYRTGHILLLPFKFIRSLFSK